LSIAAPELKSEKLEDAADTAESKVSGDVKVEPSPFITEAGVMNEPPTAADGATVGASFTKSAEET